MNQNAKKKYSIIIVLIILIVATSLVIGSLLLINALNTSKVNNSLSSSSSSSSIISSSQPEKLANYQLRTPITRLDQPFEKTVNLQVDLANVWGSVFQDNNSLVLKQENTYLAFYTLA